MSVIFCLSEHVIILLNITVTLNLYPLHWKCKTDMPKNMWIFSHTFVAKKIRNYCDFFQPYKYRTDDNVYGNRS